ncbi:MAG: P-II family nitrogen regulator [Acidobacteriota bacterium]
MKEIKAIFNEARLFAVLTSLRDMPGIPGMWMSDVRVFPRGHADPKTSSHGIDALDSFMMVKVECVVKDEHAAAVVAAIQQAAHTGNANDGKIFVSPVEEVVKVQTGERGDAAV